MAVSYVLKKGGNQPLTISATTDFLDLYDTGSEFVSITTDLNAYRSGNDLVIDIGDYGSVTVTGQFASATPKLAAIRFHGEEGTETFSLINGTTGGAGNEFIFGTGGNDNLSGGGGNNILFGGAGNDSIVGGPGGVDDENWDELHGGDGNDTLVGNGGEDYFVPGAGNDSINAAGADLWSEASYMTSTGPIVVNFSGLTVNGQLSNTVHEVPANTFDTLFGVEAVYGSHYDDHFVAGRQDMWSALPDDDVNGTTFFGMGGDDTYDIRFSGGDPQHRSMTVNFEGADASVTVNLSNATYNGVAAGEADDGLGGTDVFALGEVTGNKSLNLNIVGSVHDDVIVGSDNTNLTIGFVGAGGDDTLVGSALAQDAAAYWESPEGVDPGIIANLSGSQLVLGGVTLEANQVRDNFGGIDTLVSIENIFGGDGNDYIVGSSDNNSLQASEGNDTVFGGGGNDWIDVGTGEDSADGGLGTDTLSLNGNRGDYAVVQLDSTTYWLTKSAGDESQSIIARNFENFQFWSGSESTATLLSSALTAGNDNWSGTAGNDTADGQGGNDRLSGMEGNDSLTGSAGDDTLIGGTGADTLVGGIGNDVYYVDSNSDTVVEAAASGTDTVVVEGLASYSIASQANIENLTFGGTGNFSGTGNAGTNTLTGNVGNDTLSGGDGNDSLVGGAGNDRLIGDAGNDTLRGGTGSDMLIGGAGNDSIDGGVITDRLGYTDANTVSYAGAAAAVNVNLSGITGDGSTGSGTATDGQGGTDTLQNIFAVVGSNFADTITGSSAMTFEMFEGGAGNDTINGGTITDTLFGENGNRVSYQNATGAVTVDLAVGSASGDASTGSDQLTNINQVRGSNFGDSLTGSTRADGLTEHFEGRGGNDTIDGAGGYDVVRYDSATGGVTVQLGGAIDGSATGDASVGADVLKSIEGVRGSAHNDTLLGSDAAFEFFQGMGGNDSIDGGAGTDRVDYDRSTAAVSVTLGGMGDGLATGAATGVDTLVGIEGVRGSSFNDSLTGSDDLGIYEFFDGRGGNDTIDGGAGTDRVDYDRSLAAVTVNLMAGTAADGMGGADLLSNIEDVRGSTFNDSITGDTAANRLEGNSGNDTLLGLGGNDTLLGEAGNDLIDGGAGTDRADYSGASAAVTANLTTGVAAGTAAGDVAKVGTDTLLGIEDVLGSAFNDSITGSAASNSLTGNEGNDVLLGLDGNDLLFGEDGNDTLDGGNGDDFLSGAFGNDSLVGGAGDDGLNGGAGHDTLLGGAGRDFLEGGGGNDSIDGGVITDRLGYTDANTVSYSTAATGIHADLSNITGTGTTGTGTVLDGSGGEDTIANVFAIQGSSHADTMIGSSALTFEQFEGGLGDDSINGGTITDTLFGENGNRASYQNASGAVQVNLAAGTAQGAAGNDTLININAVRGSNYGDVLTGGTLPANDPALANIGEHFEGLGGDDTIDGGAGNDIARYDSATAAVTVQLNGASDGYATGDASVGTDVLRNIEGVRGSAHNDTLLGSGAGFEFFQGLGGNDSIDGGAGADRVDYDRSTAAVSVDLAAGTAIGTATGSDTLVGIEGVRGSDFNDTLVGSTGNDFFEGRAGNDSISGGAGADRVEYRTASAAVTVNLTTGTASGTAAGDVAKVGTDTLSGIEDVTGSIFNDSITGSAVANSLSGHSGNDTLLGLDGNDTLNGDDGNDSLDGGNGNDQLFGGAGNDTLLGGVGSDYLEGGAGNDSIDGGVITDRLNYTDANRIGYVNAAEAVNVDLSGIIGTGTGTGTVTGGASVGLDTVANVFYVQGSGYNDTITGSAARTLEVFEGGQGDDIINGGAINDTLNGDDSNRVSYQNAGGAVQVNLAAGAAQGADGNDTLSNINQVRGSSHGDSLTGSTRADGLTEHFEGRAGDDTIDGAGGLDLVRYDQAGGAVQVNLAAGTSAGADGSDVLSNIEGVRGSKFADSLTGGNVANDAFEFFMGLDGNDTIDGGSGYDRADYNLATAGVNVNLFAGTAMGDVSTGSDTLQNIEGVRGSSFADTLTGAGGSGAYTFEGREGNDTITGGSGLNDTAIYQFSKAGVTVNLTTGTAADGYGNTDTLTLNTIENVRGSRDFNDSLTGSAAANKLEGLGGNDTLDGGAGADMLFGDDGNDSLQGGAGDDNLDAGKGTDVVDGGTDNDTLVVLGDFADYTRSRPNATDTVLVNVATGENITFRNIEAVQFADGLKLLSEVHTNLTTIFNDTVVGTPGADLIDGLAGNDSLVGLGGNDTLIGNVGNDTLVGGADNDTYVVDVATDVITENAAEGTDQVNVAFTAAGTYVLGANVENAAITNATAGVNVTGNAENNAILGNAQGNILTGLAGNDSLDGGAGIDTLIGGAGDDSYVVDVAGDVINETVAGSDGTDQVNVMFTAAGTYVLSANVENAQIGNGTVGVNLTGNTGNNALLGNALANSLSGADGADTLNGGDGNDTLDGGIGNDQLFGGVGNDTLLGGVGADTMEGEGGNDVYVVDSLSDVVNESAGNGTDRVETALASLTLAAEVENLTYTGAAGFIGGGNALANSIVGAGGNDYLSGDADNDTLVGNGGNDTLDGGAGSDSMVGGLGDDVYVIDTDPGDVIFEAALGGTDRVETALAGYSLGAEVENLTFTGAGDFVGIGQGLNNVMTGGSGNDYLSGLAGNDTLNGGAGSDNLIGGSGADSLLGGAGIDFLDGGTGNDTMRGGADDDSYSVDSLTDVVFENASEGFDSVYINGTAAGTYVLADNVEWGEIDNPTAGMHLTGNLIANTLRGNAQANTLSGLDGNDNLYGNGGNDTLLGGNGNDTLWSGAGNDSIDGGSGDDNIRAFSGNDSIQGGIGSDSIEAGTGVDTVDGGSDTIGGVDTLYLIGNFSAYTRTRPTATDTRLVNGVTGEDITFRNVENFMFADGAKTLSDIWGSVPSSFGDYITDDGLSHQIDAGAGDDTIFGMGGDDTLIGGTGNDSLVGGLGDDTLVVDVAGDIIVEQNAEGTDQVSIAFTGAGTYVLSPNVEHATITNSTVGVNITGNELNNLLAGNAQANVLTGNAGNDTLNGGAGSDTLIGGAGDDEYWLDVASDVVNETAVGSTGTDTVRLGFTSTASYTLTTNVENAIVTSAGNSFAVNVTGNASNNSITGHAGANSLVGAEGNDTLIGSGGNDTIDGGIGSDTVVLDGVLTDYAISRPSGTQTNFTHIATNTVVALTNVENITFAGDASTTPLATLIAQIGSPNADTLTGGGADDTLAGGLGNDSLTGGAGNDDLQGGDGVDTLNGGAGNDLLDGGLGNDTYQFGIGGGDDIIDQNDTVVGGIDTLELTSPIGDLVSGETLLSRGWHTYDDLVVTVVSQDVNDEDVIDHIVVNDFFTNDLVNAGGAIDQIRFLSNGTTLSQAQILSELLKGTSGDDWLRGYANTNDSINGGNGHDTIGGAAGNDTLLGGGGNDILMGDAGNDSLEGNSGADQIYGDIGSDTLSGSAGLDYLSGGTGGDTYVYGLGFGEDEIEDLGGAVGDVDIVRFNAGIRATDVVVSRDGDDLNVAFTGAPTDGLTIEDYFVASGVGQIEQFVFADGSSWSATAIKAKVLVPTAGDDYLSGYLGNESLQGLAGEDTILGNGGNDTLNGGDGYDVLTGGIGADRFVFNTADALVNADLITDFVSGTDKIALSASVFGALGAPGDAVVVGGANLSYIAGTGALMYDADGAGGGAAVQFATLGTGSHPASVTSADFMIIS